MVMVMESMQLDIFMAVEELHGLSARDMSKLIKDLHSFTFRFSTGKGSSVRVDVQRLATSLPLHLLACVVSTGSEPRFRYLLRGVRLLHSLSDLALRYPKLEQLFLHEVKLREQVLDLVIYMLIVLASVEQDGRMSSFIAVLHSALVACCLYLLTAFVTREWHDVVPVLLAHPKVDVFMDAAFDVVKRDIGLLQSKLRTLHIKLASKKTTLPVAERIGEATAEQCEASLQVLQSLCQTQAFRDRLLHHKELCRRGGVLRLTLVILKLHLPSSFHQTKSLCAFISRLKSKALAMLLKFCETESVSFLDEVAGDAQSMQLAEQVTGEILVLVRSALLEEPRQIDAAEMGQKPMGSIHMNALRLADLLSDDSNFRNLVMDRIAPDLGTVLATPPTVFVSRWCAGDIAVNLAKGETDATLVYDPFQAAGAAMHASAKGATSLPANTPGSSVRTWDEMDSGCVLSVVTMVPDHYAQERSALLVKLFANLYCYNPDVCSVEEKDRFLVVFVECLASGPLVKTNSSYYLTPEQTACRICENLSVLLDHVVLSSNSVNDEDLSLVRNFSCKLHRAICPLPPSDPSIPEAPVVSFIRDAHENKLRSIHNCRQLVPLWRKIIEGSDEPQEIVANNVFPSTELPTRFFEKSLLPGGALETESLQSAEVQVEPEDLKYVKLEENRAGRSPLVDLQQREDLVISNLTEQGESADKSGKERDDVMTDRVNRVEVMETETKIADEEEGKEGTDPDANDDIAAESRNDTGRSDLHAIRKRRREVKKPSESEEPPKKRKRNIMNEKQISTVENALLTQPEMQRYPKLIEQWTEELNKIGPEIAAHQLKNWLNNRKARLARLAREGRPPEADPRGEHSRQTRSAPAADLTMSIGASPPLSPEYTRSEDESQQDSGTQGVIKSAKSATKQAKQGSNTGHITEGTNLECVFKGAVDVQYVRNQTPLERGGPSSDETENPLGKVIAWHSQLSVTQDDTQQG